MNLDTLRNWMAGNDCVVVGCGPSAYAEYTHTAAASMQQQVPVPRCWTIACNRAVTFASPDFAVCVEPHRDKTIWNIMAEAPVFAVFSHVTPEHIHPRGAKKIHPRFVHITCSDVLQWIDIAPLLDDGKRRLRLGQSTFWALAVAIVLGFETIGVIGLDLTEDRFKDKQLATSEDAYGRLRTIAESMGRRIINLNPESRLKALPSGTWEEVRRK